MCELATVWLVDRMPAPTTGSPKADYVLLKDTLPKDSMAYPAADAKKSK